jgi:hypothetical protein
VGEFQVVAAFGQLEAEHVGVEPDRAIEIADTQLDQQLRRSGPAAGARRSPVMNRPPSRCLPAHAR